MYSCVWFFPSLLRFLRVVRAAVGIRILFLFTAEWDSIFMFMHVGFVSSVGTDLRVKLLQTYLYTTVLRRIFPSLKRWGAGLRWRESGQGHLLGAWGSLGPPHGDQDPVGS